MRKFILIPVFIFFILLGGMPLFVTDEAYAWCCPCPRVLDETHMVSSTYLVGCSKPGKDGCAWCAVPGSETLRSGKSGGNSPSDMRAIHELPLHTITPIDPIKRVLTLMRGGECGRRSVEMRLLSSVGDNIS